MILLDVNILLYANDTLSEFHEPIHEWFAVQHREQVTFAIPWSVLHGFMRIGTNPRIFRNAMTPENGLAASESFLTHPNVLVIEPGPRYWAIFRDLVTRTQARGNKISDIHIAALAIEYDAAVCTGDRGFAQFPGVRVINPLTP